MPIKISSSQTDVNIVARLLCLARIFYEQMNGNDDELLVKAKQGDCEAFSKIFESYRPLVYGIAFRYVGSNDADDVVMQTLLKAWKSLPGYNGKSSLKTWLFRITYNTSMDFHKKNKSIRRRVVLENDQDEELNPNQSGADPNDPAKLMIQSEIASTIKKAIQSLEKDHRITLQLRFGNDLSYKEIAAATGVSIGTVMSRIFNGKKKLKRLLQGSEMV